MAEPGDRARPGDPSDALEPAGFFVLRTPLLPLDALRDWTAPDGPAGDGEHLRGHLARIVAHPAVRDALFVASPDLESGIAAWLSAPGSERSRKVELALVRYVSRMAARPTPFGLFAGCSLGSVAGATRLRLPATACYRRHTRLDMGFVADLCERLGRDEHLWKELTYRPNTSLYPAGGRLHYVESRIEGGRRAFHLVAVEPTPHLERVLRAAGAGGATPAQLAAVLVDDEIDEQDAGEYIAELVQTQVLVSELEPAVTGDHPARLLEGRLAPHRAGGAAAAALREANARLARIDRAGVGASPADYRAAAEPLRALPAEPDIARIFQVDLTKPAPDLRLAPLVAEEVCRAVRTLREMTAAPADRLQPFRDAFIERYDQREVPLAEALDEQLGIGFPALDPREARAPAPGRQAFLLERVFELIARGGTELVLGPGDVEPLRVPAPAALPSSTAAMFSIAAVSAEAVDRGEFQLVLHGVMGPAGTSLLGRFCYADEGLRDAVAGFHRAEEARSPAAIHAEVVHLPEGRLGNILHRPVMREHEIPFLAAPAVGPEHQIPVDDLLVCVRDGRIVLRSKARDRQVVPRLTSAHNFAAPRNLALYRFLCTLQAQDGTAPFWDWGPLREAPFLPRVRIGRVVVARAAWRMSKAEIAALGESRGDAAVAEARRWRERRRLPRWVLLADGDNQMPVDFENALSVRSFLHLVRGRASATLFEMLPGPDDLPVEGPEGRFTHEIILPLLARRPAAAAPAAGAPAVASARRRLVPGSEWLFVKIYSGAAVLDRLLRDEVAAVVGRLLRADPAMRWFFIRYRDPHEHLRLRFGGSAGWLRDAVLPEVQALAERLCSAGLAWRVQHDTYEREIERYGGLEGTLAAERLFQADSEAVLGLLREYPGDDGLAGRRLLATRGVDRLMSDFGLGPERKAALLRSLPRPDGATLARWSAEYRRQRPEVERALAPMDTVAPELRNGGAILLQRSRRIREVAEELAGLERGGVLTQPVETLVLSFTHMHCNRLLRTEQPQQERQIYDVLQRYHASRVARGIAGPAETLAERPETAAWRSCE